MMTPADNVGVKVGSI